MIKFLKLLLLLIFIFSSTFSYALSEDDNIVEDPLELTAKTAILIDSVTGEVIYGKEAHKKMFPASTTKILTAIVAIENSNLSEKVIVDNETPHTITGSHIALEPGEVLSMNDLLYALLIESANDAAVVIAKHISGSVENFSKLMNEKAQELGAKNSNFINPNGLPDENHISTAYDLAMIAKYAMQNEIFSDIVNKYTYTIEPTNKKSDARYLRSSNRLLYSNEKITVNDTSVPIKYDDITGVKTGYTMAAQQCLVSSVSRDNQSYISVALHSIGTDIYVDTHKLFDFGFNNYKPIKVASKGEFVDNIFIKNASSPFVTTVFSDDLYISTPIGKNVDLKREFKVAKDIKAPISKGQVVGNVVFKVDDSVIGSIDVISSINTREGNFILKNFFNYILNKWWFWLAFSLIFLRLHVGFNRIKRRIRKLRREKRIRKRVSKLY